MWVLWRLDIVKAHGVFELILEKCASLRWKKLGCGRCRDHNVSPADFPNLICPNLLVHGFGLSRPFIILTVIIDLVGQNEFGLSHGSFSVGIIVLSIVMSIERRMHLHLKLITSLLVVEQLKMRHTPLPTLAPLG